jgi:hypothetical protein
MFPQLPSKGRAIAYGNSLHAKGAGSRATTIPRCPVGSLQGKSGPSVATEFGVLLPDSTGDSGVGVSWAGIVSQRWEWGTIHFNTETMLTRDHRADVFVGSIIEGPSTWKVRPVTEVFYEKEFGLEETISGLVGLIWQVSDEFFFDVAFRHTQREAILLKPSRKPPLGWRQALDEDSAAQAGPPRICAPVRSSALCSQSMIDGTQ